MPGQGISATVCRMPTAWQHVADDSLGDHFVILSAKDVSEVRVEAIDGPWILEMIRRGDRGYRVNTLVDPERRILWTRPPRAERICGIYTSRSEAERVAALNAFW